MADSFNQVFAEIEKIARRHDGALTADTLLKVADRAGLEPEQLDELLTKLEAARIHIAADPADLEPTSGRGSRAAVRAGNGHNGRGHSGSGRKANGNGPS